MTHSNSGTETAREMTDETASAQLEAHYEGLGVARELLASIRFLRGTTAKEGECESTFVRVGLLRQLLDVAEKALTPSSPLLGEGLRRQAWIDAANITRELLIDTFNGMQDDLADEPRAVETLQALIESLESRADFAEVVATIAEQRAPATAPPPLREEMVERGARAMEPKTWVVIEHYRATAACYRETPFAEAGFQSAKEANERVTEHEERAAEMADASLARARACLTAATSLPTGDPK